MPLKPTNPEIQEFVHKYSELCKEYEMWLSESPYGDILVHTTEHWKEGCPIHQHLANLIKLYGVPSCQEDYTP